MTDDARAEIAALRARLADLEAHMASRDFGRRLAGELRATRGETVAVGQRPTTYRSQPPPPEEPEPKPPSPSMNALIRQAAGRAVPPQEGAEE
jgi:hypothetical protein